MIAILWMWAFGLHHGHSNSVVSNLSLKALLTCELLQGLEELRIEDKTCDALFFIRLNLGPAIDILEPHYQKFQNEQFCHSLLLEAHKTTMAKEKPSTDVATSSKDLIKKEKKEKKRSETDGVKKPKKEKKEKKPKSEKKRAKFEEEDEAEQEDDDVVVDDKKSKSKSKKAAEEAKDVEMTTALVKSLEDTKPGSVLVKEGDGEMSVVVKERPLLGALVPFAVPLADEKVGKKVLKGVRKGMFEYFIPEYSHFFGSPSSLGLDPSTHNVQFLGSSWEID
ncbi:MAG: hypothetical protein Q9220_006482 [cf. Caloplaca sp. 1 TL-2023]